jgi:hypothetical protein
MQTKVSEIWGTWQAEAEANIKKFIQQQAALPEDQKIYIDNAKYDGPIGQPVDKQDDPSANTQQ